MDSKQLAKVWKDFFYETIEGQHFIAKLDEMIKSRHEDAEKNPDNARDYSQRAYGIREIKNIISSTTADIKTKSSVERKE